MDKDVVIFRVLHGYNQVVRTFRRKVLAHRQEVRNAKLSAEVDRLGGSKISDVDLTVYDSVDVVSGRDGHARGVVVGCRDGGRQRGAVWAF
jgi:hypothetical protein